MTSPVAGVKWKAFAADGFGGILSRTDGGSESEARFADSFLGAVGAAEMDDA
ncbi:hypothetical protein AB0C34_15795 [Nocardia sp. NPDC049220]|uniref:hypothetical protein n=1 Tax=Nocardia sp. NPDC049220 TaxID=3155273 RepID=UPI0033E1188C